VDTRSNERFADAVCRETIALCPLWPSPSSCRVLGKCCLCKTDLPSVTAPKSKLEQRNNSGYGGRRPGWPLLELCLDMAWFQHGHGVFG
jgi:hypothetical protein